MASSRAPKQWCLTTEETVTSFENWKQNLTYILSTDQNFTPFLGNGFSWGKKKKQTPLRGFTDDAASIPEPQRKTAVQKVTCLELMLGQVANFCPVIARNTIVQNSTSLSSIWQVIRAHYGFQATGAHILDFADLHLQSSERPEDLYQRIMAFLDDNLLKKDGGLTHHSEKPADDEEMTPSLENHAVLTWLRLLHPGLPRLVRQRYGTELRSRTLASIKPEISQAVNSLLEELQSSEEAKIMRSGIQKFHKQKTRPQSRFPTKGYRSEYARCCPLCKQAGRDDTNHFLSKCTFLPESDRRYLAKSRNITCEDEVTESDTDDEQESPQPQQKPRPATTSRVQVKISPFIHMFYGPHPVRITIDSGAETNMIRESVAQFIGAKVTKSNQFAIQADGQSPLDVTGEINVFLVHGRYSFQLQALVVRNLDVDVLAGVPFMELNDISIRPARREITFKDGFVHRYGADGVSKGSHAVRRAQAHLLRGPSKQSTIWPGEYMELDVPEGMPMNSLVAIEPRTDTVRDTTEWLMPTVAICVAGKVRITNTDAHPHTLKSHAHFGQILPIFEPEVDTPIDTTNIPSAIHNSTSSHINHASSVQVDPEKLLEPGLRAKFFEVNETYADVFHPRQHVYNGSVGHFEAVVNMGPVQPPQRKGRLPQYNKDKLVELQSKFDELEADGVFARPEEAGVTVEYLNPSFLIKKPSGSYRLVTAFADVGRYSKPQPSLMPDVDSTLRLIAQWRYIIATDLSSAFFQIKLAKQSLRYCGVVTPFKGVRVYTRCAMGMPGSETALEELMCRLFGDLLQEGVVAKLADDLYIGGNSPNELLHNWERVLRILHSSGMGLSPGKTIVNPKTTTILGWIWSQGQLRASPHRISTLSTCTRPVTVSALRSFIGAYKVLSRVLPNCSGFVSPLDEATAGKTSSEKIAWTDELTAAFSRAQAHLSSNTAIVLPRPTDQLWIVTDGSTKLHGLGATLYVSRENAKPLLAGFFSAKLRKRQDMWLPCEIEALCIAAAIKHFSPFIIQSEYKACILTDSKPCVQAFEKLCRGEFSASPRVLTFLSTVSRYQASIRHLKGSANVPSDFASRNAPECTEPSCQVCSFVTRSETASVMPVTVQDVMSGSVSLPFSNRATWMKIQSECRDLRRAHAHLTQGTRPTKKVTNANDVKRYINVCTIARDGLIVVKREEPFHASRECIVVPREVLPGLLTALHIRLDHPSCYQLKKLSQRYFYALDLDTAVDRLTSSCHTCQSVKRIPQSLVAQSTEEPPTTVGQSFAADVLKRNRQLIFIIRESVTSYTSGCIIENERKSTLRQALLTQVSQFRSTEGPPAIIRCDPAPGFDALRHDDVLQENHVSLDIGRVKNTNKNPVAEKAIQELEGELKRQQLEGGYISEETLARAINALNSRIRKPGLSAREMWLQRDQFTHEQLPVSDRELIQSQHETRTTNHPHSAKSKAPLARPLLAESVQVGDLVYLYNDGEKTRARSRYLVIESDVGWCSVRKFTGSQLRGKIYRVKRTECYKVPTEAFDHKVAPCRESSESEAEDDEPTMNSPSCSATGHPQVPTVPDALALSPGAYHAENRPIRKSTRVTRPPRYLADYVYYNSKVKK